MSLCWNPQMRNTTALRGVHGTDRLRSERVWLTEVSACELSQDSERARLGGAGAWLPILRILDQSLLTAIIGDEAGHVFHPQTVPGDRSPLWPLSFTTTAQHTTKKKKNRQMDSHNACSTARDDYAKHSEGMCTTRGSKKIKNLGYMNSLTKSHHGNQSLWHNTYSTAIIDLLRVTIFLCSRNYD